MSDDGSACSCITCSDQAVDMTVNTLDAELELATCADADGNRHQVDLGLLDGVEPGSHVLVHAGTAIAIAPEPRS